MAGRLASDLRWSSIPAVRATQEGGGDNPAKTSVIAPVIQRPSGLLFPFVID